MTRFALTIGEYGDVYLLDRETDEDTDLGHLDSPATWKRCPSELKGDLLNLDYDWRNEQAERERVGREDRKCREREYLASRGI